MMNTKEMKELNTENLTKVNGGIGEARMEAANRIGIGEASVLKEAYVF